VKRREFIVAFVMAQLAVSPQGETQQTDGKLPRIGLLFGVRSENSDALIEGLRMAGHTDGQNVVLETRFQGMSPERIDELANELVALKCNVIFAADPYAIRGVMKASKSVPIVGIDLETDPVANGWAQSLARPGGNLTGFFLDIPEMGGKLIEFARDVIPDLTRLGVVWDEAIGVMQFSATETAARALGVTTISLPTRRLEEISDGLERAARARTQCIIVLSSPLFFRWRSQIVDLALQQRLPTISVLTSFPKVGGLLAYGPNLPAMFIRAATYIDRILSGTKPGDLPIQRPSKFTLAINAKSASTLGLSIPESLLSRADEVIE
jgi:putative ABC transport system substrate-binding protein